MNDDYSALAQLAETWKVGGYGGPGGVIVTRDVPRVLAELRTFRLIELTKAIRELREEARMADEVGWSTVTISAVSARLLCQHVDRLLDQEGDK